MIRITIDEVPAGDPRRARRIETVFVANTDPSLPAVSSYVVWAASATNDRGLVTGHTRARGWLPLVARALDVLAARRAAPALHHREDPAT